MSSCSLQNALPSSRNGLQPRHRPLSAHHLPPVHIHSRGTAHSPARSRLPAAISSAVKPSVRLSDAVLVVLWSPLLFGDDSFAAATAWRHSLRLRRRSASRSRSSLLSASRWLLASCRRSCRACACCCLLRCRSDWVVCSGCDCTCISSALFGTLGWSACAGVLVDLLRSALASTITPRP